MSLLIVAAVSQPFWLAPLLARLLAQSSGRSVSFDSAYVGLTSDLQPALHCRGVRIDNAPWADSPRPFARLGEFIAVLSWKTLLQPRAVISLMVLRDGEVDLERQADGLRNWRLRDPDNRGPGRYQVLALRAERASVRFRHAGLGLVLEAKSSPSAENAAMPTHLDITGQWRSVGFESQLATGPVLSFLGTDRLFPVRGWVTAGGARLEIDGQAGDIFREPLFDARVALTGNSLAPFSGFLGARFAASPRRDFRLAGQFRASDHAYVLTALTARLGATDLAGELELERTRSPLSTGSPVATAEAASAPASAPVRHALRARLRSELLDVADLRWLAGPQAPAAAASAASASASTDGRPALARRHDASLSFEAARVRLAEAPWLRSAAVEAALTDGLLRVTKFDLGVMQGHASGHGEIDLRPSPPSAQADLALEGVRIEQLLVPRSEKKRVTGLLHAHARLQANGDTAKALLASASGTATARLTGGTISSLLDAEIGLQGGKIVRGLLGGNEDLAVRCAAAAVELQRGAGTLRSLVFDTERTRSTGSGRFDLRAQTLDLVLTPEAKQGGLFVLERSIRLHGPLRKPERELVARAGPSVPAGRTACPA